MLYKIKGIKHSGTLGERYSERTDGQYQNRIGRTVDIDIDNIELDYPLIIHYVKDSDGTPIYTKYLRTSHVKDFNVINTLDGTAKYLTVETENSIFEFERIYEDE